MIPLNGNDIAFPIKGLNNSSRNIAFIIESGRNKNHKKIAFLKGVCFIFSVNYNLINLYNLMKIYENTIHSP